MSQLKIALLTFGYNFPSLVLLISASGVWRASARRTRLFRYVLLAQTIVIGGFIARYAIPDLYTYFVPICLLVALWFGVGADKLLRWNRARQRIRWLPALLWLHALIPLAVYVYFPIWAEQQQIMRARWRDLPYRNEYTAFFRPWRCGDDSAERFARAALERVGPGGWLLADNTTGPTTAYWNLVHGGPGDARIYRERTALIPPDRPLLSVSELAEFARTMGHVVVVPGGNAEHIWSEHFAFDKREADFWYIRPGGVPDSPAP